MPVFMLNKNLVFPDPELAEEDGLIAIGGDLSIDRLLAAYANGIFPWYMKGEPILWWSPDPRCILFPENIHVSRSMKKFLKKNLYKVTYDKSFDEVIGMCRSLRENETWITNEMTDAYIGLHRAGFAHSVEVWYEEKLVGGLYGVSLGTAFFGESMFSAMENASKVALISLSSRLKAAGFKFIDCQVYNGHLESMGAVNIPRIDFLKLLHESVGV
ncbi:MAG TPA: leucyl/phenylalanyl-tRNA--protein transferase [Clostridia bacterium]